MRSRSNPLTVRPAGGPRLTGIALVASVVLLAASLGGAGALLGQATAVRVQPDPTSTGNSQGPSDPGGSGDRNGQRGAAVPPQYAPPGGMCRVWVDHVPPEQQPAPTQCAKAVRVRSPNSRVVFGPSRPGQRVSGTGVSAGRISSEHPVGQSGRVVVPHPPTPDVPTTPRVENKDHAGTRVPMSPPPHRNPPPPPPHMSARAHR